MFQRKWQCQIYFQKILPIPSVEKWPFQGCRAFFGKVMDDFSFRLIFSKISNSYEPEKIRRKNWQNWFLGDQMFGNEVVLITLVSDEGDDVVEGNGGWQKGSEKRTERYWYLCTFFKSVGWWWEHIYTNHFMNNNNNLICFIL